MRFLGGPSGINGSPCLWASDHDSYFTQGYPVPNRPDQVRIPDDLFRFMEPGVRFATDTTDLGTGWHVVTGLPITDRDPLQVMQIPSHETAVEVPVTRKA